MSKKNDTNNLAIIGASGTGKTVLITGLYATSTPEFTVSPVGDATRNYLDPRKTAIEQGVWPAATNEQEFLDLRLRLHAGGKETDIVFREYMGERMDKDPNYIQEVIGTPKAAMILFNPDMPGLKDAESRNRMIGNIKTVAQHLKDHRCSDIAFVVTASDRLASDLAGFRDDFENYAAEVTNHLKNLGFNLKRFDVSVSGELADQNHPKLARGENNTTHAPFLWLLDRIHSRIRREKLRKAAEWAAGIAVAAAIAMGVSHQRSANRLDEAETEIVRVSGLMQSSFTRKDLAGVQTNFVNLAAVKTNLQALAAWGRRNRERREALIADLSDKCDLWQVQLLKMDFEDRKAKLTNQPEGWADKFDGDLKVANATSDEAKAELSRLREAWSKERLGLETLWQTIKLSKVVSEKRENLRTAATSDIPARMKEGYDFLAAIDSSYPLATNRTALSASLNVARTNALARYVKAKFAYNVTDETPPLAGDALRLELQKQLKRGLSDDELRALDASLSESQAKARREWEAHWFPKRTRERIEALGKAEDNPVPALKSSLSFLATMTNDFQTVTQLQFVKAREEVNAARGKALAAYADSLESKWDVNGRKPPEFDSQKLRSTVLTDAVVTGDESTTFMQDMDRRFNAAKRKWDEHQKKLVDAFVARELSSPENALSALGAYMEFRQNNLANPYLSTVDAKMVSSLEKRLDWLVDEYYREFRGNGYVWSEADVSRTRMERAEDNFKELRDICLAIQNPMLDGSPIRSSWVNRFSSECISQGRLKNSAMNAAFPQRFDMTRIDVKVDYRNHCMSFIGLSMGAQAISRIWDGSVKIASDTTLVNVEYRNFTISEGDSGRWFTLWSGNLSIPFNPWMDSYLLFSMEDRVDIGSNSFDAFTWTFWREDERGKKWYNGYHEFSGDVDFPHNGGNTRATVTYRIYGKYSGPDLETILKASKR